MKILLVLLILAIVILLPLAIIWSMNTLFLLGIPYTIATWAATFVLTSIFSKYKGSKND